MQRIAFQRTSHKIFSTMCVMLLLMIVATAFQSAAPAYAATAPVSLFPDDPYSVFTNAQGGSKMSYQTVEVSGQDFTQALQMQTLQAPESPYSEGEYSISLAGSITAAVNEGDALLATFWARAARPGRDGYAYSSFQFERNGGDYTKSATEAIKVGRRWQRFQFPFKAAESYQPGEAQVSFWLGYNPQTLQIGGLSVLDYGQEPPDDYPSVTYEGREANASWRADAEARIEKYRKGDLRIIVRDTHGRPVRNATVHVDMQRQAFEFGSAISASRLLANTPDGERYRQVIAQQYNTVVLGNDLKWPEWEDQGARDSQTLPALQWLHEHNIDVRGHNLVWPSWKWLPGDLQSLKDNPEALKNRIDTHIQDEVSALQGQVVSWDVLNEPYANHDLMDILGSQAMADWFKTAKASDPNVPLFINDYNNLEHNGWNERQMDYYYDTIKSLLKQGAPVEAIGLQSHFDALQPTSPTELLKVLNRYAKLGLPMQVTEFDFNTTDEQLQADYTRDFMTLLYSYPQVTGIIHWGFWEPDHWRPNGAQYRTDWSLKPNGQVWQDLVLHQWWTNDQGTTNRGGVYKTRGFLGDYNVSVTVDGVTKTVQTSLSSRYGKTLTIIVDGKPSAPPTQVENLTLNGSFEAGNVAWASIGDGGQLVTDAHSGNQAFQTGTTASGWDQNLVGVQAGTNYTLTGWGKVNGGDETCWIGIRGGKYPGLPSYIQVLPITEHQYTQQSLSFTVPADTSWQKIFLWKDSGDGSSTCTFDDLVLTPTAGDPPPEPEPPAVLPQLPAEPGLLANGDFEQGTSRWYCFGPCTLAATDDPVHGGGHAASITNRTDSWQGVGQDITSQVGNGGTYQTSAWVRTGSGGGNATGTITLKVATSTGTNYYNLTSAAINEDGWTKLQSATIKLNWTGTLQSAEWYVSTSDGTADLVVDDATFDAVPPPTTTEKLSNPGFEQSSSGWYCFGPCTLSVVSDPVHGGSGAASVTNRTDSWQGVGQNVTALVENGGTYQTSAWVRTGSGEASTTGVITLKLATSDGTNYYSLASATINDGDWTKIQSNSFQITWTGELQSAEWYINTSDGTASLLVDDVSLVALSS